MEETETWAAAAAVSTVYGAKPGTFGSRLPEVRLTTGRTAPFTDQDSHRDDRDDPQPEEPEQRSEFLAEPEGDGNCRDQSELDLEGSEQDSKSMKFSWLNHRSVRIAILTELG